VVLPIFLLLVAVALDAGRVFYSQITLTDAAREGALEAASNPTSYISGQPCDKDSNRVVCRTINESHGSFITVTPADIALTCTPSCTSGLGNRVTVTVRGNFSVITPLLWPLIGRNLTLSATADAQIETPPNPNAAPSASPSPMPSQSSQASMAPTASAGPSASPSPTPSASPCLAPNASFTVSPAGGYAYKNKSHPGTTFEFADTSTNVSSNCNPVWSWNFGDGAGTSQDPNPTYAYQAGNTGPGYTVTLVLTTSAGTSSATYIVSVAP
jgi:hypothetical protein